MYCHTTLAAELPAVLLHPRVGHDLGGSVHIHVCIYIYIYIYIYIVGIRL